MRVLHIINSLEVGGAEKLVVLLVPELRKTGVEADLLLLNGDRTIFYSQLESKGISNVRSLELVNIYSPLALIKMCLELHRVRKYYDVIHTHLFPTQYLTVFGKLLTGIDAHLVTTEQNTTNRRRTISFFKFLDKRIYRRYAAIAAVSPIATEFLIKFVDKPSIKFSTIANAVDIEAFSNVEPYNIRSELGLDENTKLAIQVSSFSAQKDHDTLIKAFADIGNKTLHLLLVGDGSNMKEMMLLASKLNLKDRVHFLGIRNDIPALLKAADIAVLSSHYEGLSLFVLEAFAAGTPVIGTSVPGLEDIIRQGGKLVPHKNIQKLSNALDQLSTDPKVFNRYKLKGDALINEYSIDKIAKQYVDIYRSVLRVRNTSIQSKS